MIQEHLALLKPPHYRSHWSIAIWKLHRQKSYGMKFPFGVINYLQLAICLFLVLPGSEFALQLNRSNNFVHHANAVNFVVYAFWPHMLQQDKLIEIKGTYSNI